MTRVRRATTVAGRIATVVVGVLAALPLVAVALLAAATPAQATSYRYWTYWWGSDTGRSASGWAFAQVGPAGHRVNDTWVLGWRFERSSTTTATARPRQSPDFATLCPSLHAAVDGMDRVALVVDYGTTADAPPGQTPPSTSTVRVECLTLQASPHDTGAQVLAAAHVTVRSENGLICALDSYPVGECAPVVPDPTPTPAATSSRPRTSVAASTTPKPVASRSASSSPTSARSASVTSSAAASGSAATSAAETSPSAGPSDTVLPAAAGAPTTVEQSAGSPLGLLVGAAVVAAVAASAWWTSRRRGRAP